ncbi:unnamed protein product [Zymoseptoria tritici ST99CH_3D7]|uniref:Uncharacterized protein n=1 Tax=Zymoseptoria tritici (strain ST99CH_3D7) TaxID=1276538 RepID=A0A1X7S3C7_ZYMT9|nr:unnamed protein product [Zymoseptoria tritici ST99CH_3D7]
MTEWPSVVGSGCLHVSCWTPGSCDLRKSEVGFHLISLSIGGVRFRSNTIGHWHTDATVEDATKKIWGRTELQEPVEQSEHHEPYR